MFRVYCGEHEINLNVFKFPGGELHFKMDTAFENMRGLRINVETDLGTSDEVMLLVLFADYCFRKGVRILLELKYLPYARQDRETSVKEPFSLLTMGKLINSLGFEEVKVYDPHSDVTGAVIENIKIVDRKTIVRNNNIVYKWLREPNAVIVAPDAGAIKKNFDVAQMFKLPLVVASKHRNTLTGEIDRTTIDTQNIDINGKSLVILDDICDGGKTFIELAKAIRKDYTPKEIKLFVTVGIFSKGVDVVANEFDGIAWHYLKQ